MRMVWRTVSGNSCQAMLFPPLALVAAIGHFAALGLAATKVDTMDNADMPARAEDFHRRFSRFKVSAPVIIERGDDPPSLGMTANAAVGGCCLLVNDAIWWSVGDRVRLTFEDDQIVMATIRWSKLTFISVEFDNAVDALILDNAAKLVSITAGEIRPVVAEDEAPKEV